MPKAVKDSYDAVIIGAGMSGLICGCCLAKAGMKNVPVVNSNILKVLIASSPLLNTL